ncbi:MAG: cytochrome P450 [bacterium]|nr:cytochrome P450 [bacterium]
MHHGQINSGYVTVPYVLTAINGISSLVQTCKQFIVAVPQTIRDTYQLWRNRNHLIMDDLYQRSAGNNITIAHIGLPFAGLPKIVVIGGNNRNVLQIAAYGEGETKDPEARFVFADVAKMLGVKTIANVQGAEASEQRRKLKQHILTPSFASTLKITQYLMQKGLDNWDYTASFQHNISYIVVNILGKTVYGISQVDSKYIPRIRNAAGLLFGHNASSKEFISVQNEIKVMNEQLLSQHADAIFNGSNYIKDQVELKGDESREERIEKLIAVRGASGLLVEGNVSGALMIAIACIFESAEIKQQLRDELSNYLAVHSLNADDVKGDVHFPYLDCVYKEALRFLTPQAVIARKTSVATTLRIEDKDQKVSYYSVPKHSYLFAPIRSIHHDPHYWPNPATFDPSRFANKANKGLNYYTPFSIGPRSCPAVSGFAEIIIKTAILKTMEYEIQLNKKTENIQVGTMHSHWLEEYYALKVIKRVDLKAGNGVNLSYGL